MLVLECCVKFSAVTVGCEPFESTFTVSDLVFFKHYYLLLKQPETYEVDFSSSRQLDLDETVQINQRTR